MGFFSKFADQNNREKTIAYVTYVAAAVVSGCVAVGVASSFSYFEELHLKLFQTHKILVLCCAPLFFWFSCYIIFRFAPYAGGSGIPQVIRANELSRSGDPNFVKLNTLRGSAIKFLSAMLGLLGGASIGREGPTAQISASIFQFAAAKLKRFSPHIKYHDFLTAGASAGVAAAFNAPLAGVVFAYEEIAAGHFDSIKNYVLLAIILAGVAAQAIGGNYIYFGVFNLTQEGPWLSLLHAIFVGVVCGIFGAVFYHLTVLLRKKIRALPKNKKQFLLPFVLGLAVMTIGLTTDGLTFGPGAHIAKEALLGNIETPWYVSPLKLLATLFSFVSGMGGGIFAPSLSTGALFGITCASFIKSTSAGLLSLMGMASFLAAVTHAPLTAFIIVIELTDKHVAVLPIMLAVFVSRLTSAALGAEPIYHRISRDLSE